MSRAADRAAGADGRAAGAGRETTGPPDGARAGGEGHARPRRRVGPRTVWLLLALWLLTGGGLAVLAWQAARPLPAADVVVANDLVRTVEANWPALAVGGVGTAGLDRFDGLDYTVVDASGRLLLAHGVPVTDELSAARGRAATYDVRADDPGGVATAAGSPSPTTTAGGRSAAGPSRVIGRVYVTDPTAPAVAGRLPALARTAAAVLLAAALLTTAWVLWWRSRVVVPFLRLQEFAADIAAGRLDAPLRMDRAHLFGAFTESFDIMRGELTRARAAEQAAHESKRTLVSQLGHDIRTPLASLGATAELLAVTEADPARRERLDVVLAKTRQIDALVDELFEANAEQLEALPVVPEPHPSAELAALVRRADPTGLVRRVDVPDCLVDLDPRRTQQVLDNVLGNAAKYGAPPVDVTGAIDAGLLALTIRDHGPGVSEEDLPRLTAQRFRGANAADLPGFGLGLFTSSWLMERMGGSLTCHNVAGGFAVVLEFPCP